MRRSISFAALLVVAAACIASAAAAPNVQFNKVMPEAGEGGKETIVLQNVGDAAADLTGWSIVESGSAAKPAYFFGGDTASYQRNPTQWCSNFTSLGAGEEMSLYPYNRDRFSSDFMPCGVRFELPYNGQLELRNAAGKPVDTVSWKAAKENMAIYRMGNQYVTFHEGSDLASSIEGSPMLRLFAKALEKTGVMNDYLVDGATIKVSEDSWLGKKLKQDGYGKTYYKGPYTVFAPSDDAFASFMKEMGWFGMTLTEDELMAMPELEDILKYHIVVGQAYSESIANNTGLVSMKDGSEVAVFKGKKQEFLVHDDCVDRPSPDDYGCRMQADWRKCNEDWVQDDGLFSGRPLGYCERSCKRCTCEGGQCARSSIFDIPSSNGVLHVIDKVMYPAPSYDIPETHWRTKEEIQAEMDSASTPKK